MTRIPAQSRTSRASRPAGSGAAPGPDLLPGDNPQAYLPEDRRRAVARGEDLPTRARGAAVFVDISGFTPLTEALARELGARRGAEELGATLDRVFAALTEPLHAWGGSVVYFSGDAVTAWVDGDDGRRAVACGQQMQAVMDRVGTVSTPGGVDVRLGVKVAVAVGEVHRFVVGDPAVQLLDVLAGGLVDSLAAAEQQCRPGEVVLDAGALDALGEDVELARLVGEGPTRVGAVARLRRGPGAPAPVDPWPTLPLEQARRWLLPAVWERMSTGRGEFLTDLRPAVPVFVHFGGIDLDHDPGAAEVLDAFVTRAQRVLDDAGGNLLQLTIGDKGAYLYAVHGTPVAHEDDASRACSAALALLDVARGLPVTDVRIGVATGRLRSGTYGHPERRTFCCLGDAVNLAARLMSRAPAGQVWVEEAVAAATGDRFAWTELEELRVKGRRQRVRARRLEGRGEAAHAVLPTPAAGRRLVGREGELALLRAAWEEARSGRGQVRALVAEAGTGKSRLAAELVADLGGDEAFVAVGEASALATRTPYAAWRAVWARLLETTPGAGAATDNDTAVASLDPALVPRAPLLATVLGTPARDNELTASFDGELRKTSLEDLLARLLEARARTGPPLLLVLEDVHWLDPLSRDLLRVLVRRLARSRVLLLLLTRPDGLATPGPGAPAPGGLATDDGIEGHLAHVGVLPLSPLQEAAATELVVARHRDLTGEDPDPDLVAAVLARAEGNPFYLEQLVDHVAAHARDGGGEADALELPTSLHSLVLSRIDAQQEGPRRTLKVASVIGRSFRSPLVAQAYPDLGGEPVVHDDLLELGAARLVEVESEVDRAFAFGHAVTRDVAYDSLPFGVRRVLHRRVGDALESEPDGPRVHLDLLAHHFWLGDDADRSRRYLLLAADAARAAYSHQAAVTHLERALTLLPGAERPPVLLRLADSLELLGRWTAAEEVVLRALEAATTQDDDAGAAAARTARAEIARKQGRYTEAEAHLREAEQGFTDLEDRSGLARVLHLRGTLCSQQGDTTGARRAYEAALGLRTDLGDEAGTAALLTNLALVAEDEGDLDGAERLGQEGLTRRRALGDRRAESVSLTNMGMLAAARGDLVLARERFTEAQALAEQVGDPWVVAVGRHNLGNTTRDLGDLAGAAGHLRAALSAYAERDDRWSLAHLLEDVALWLLAQEPLPVDLVLEVVDLLAAAARLRLQIGAPRFAPTEQQLADALAPALLRTPPERVDAARDAGDAARLEDTVTRVDQLLAGSPAG